MVSRSAGSDQIRRRRRPPCCSFPFRFPAVRSAEARSLDFDWITIPAGDFLMGSDKKKDKQAYDDETPQHTLHLPEYRIARAPVTVAQFAAFMAANAGYRTMAGKQGSAWSEPARSGRRS